MQPRRSCRVQCRDLLSNIEKRRLMSAWIGKQVYVHFDNWGRFSETPIRPGEMCRTELATVLAETPLRYRVRFDEDWPRGSKGDEVLVPKWALLLNEKGH